MPYDLINHDWQIKLTIDKAPAGEPGIWRVRALRRDSMGHWAGGFGSPHFFVTKNEALAHAMTAAFGLTFSPASAEVA